MCKKSNVLFISGVNYESVVDGDGVRAAIFLSGCSHRCPGCHNEAAQNPTYGYEATDELIDDIAFGINLRDDMLTGVTLTGGDPLYNEELTREFLQRLLMRIRRKDMTVWLYTGNTYEDCSNMKIMEQVDVVVDGEFIESEADRTLRFRGSKNQRIIDVWKSRTEGKTVIWNGAWCGR